MTKGDLFLELCRLTAEIPVTEKWDIYSIPYIADHMQSTKYAVRKAMKQLEADGLVCRDYIGGQDDEGYAHCYHGWSLTRKALDSELYKQCEVEAVAEWERFSAEFDRQWQENNKVFAF